MDQKDHKASCLCGAISVTVTGDLPEADACHCSQCRKQSGHYWASVDLPMESVSIGGEDNVRWYQASEKVRRGFCQTCGSFLFWDPIHHDKIAIAMGAFDGPTQTKLFSHIFVADKGDYYDIEPGVLQKDQ
ncbi:MAG: GFA family protein [Parasphingorhabdus sp.]